MTGEHEHPGDVDADGYCELHAFQPIGRVSSDVGTFAIIDIGSGPALNDWFTHLTGNDIADPPELTEAFATGRPPESIPMTPASWEWARKRTAAEQELRQFLRSSSHEVEFPGWKGLPEDGVVVNTGQGFFPVYARYCDHYGTGHMSICELRIDLHRHEDDFGDEDGEA